MNNQTDAWYLQQCLDQIEHKLAWGPHTDWTNYDFEKLSETISDATGVTLSISTLKRLWGKVTYKNVPALNTLNTLARFAGYEDWRGLKKNVPGFGFEVSGSPDQSVISNSGSKPDTRNPTHETQNPTRKTRNPKQIYLLLGLVPLAAAIYFLTSLKKHIPEPNPSQFQFSANKMVTSGLPNSVIFRYDATAAKSDSVYIVQTWDINRKTFVPKNKHEHSAIYYYPGFFRTKLIADGHVVKTHDLLVGTDGWLALAEQQPTPLYFKNHDFDKDEHLEISRATLDSYNLPLHPDPPKVRFFYMSEMGGITNDNFMFETSIKNDFDEGVSACTRVEVLIQCVDDIIIIPLAAPGCVGDLFVYACGKSLNSKDTDLSNLGCDLRQWNDLRVETINKQMSIYVNNRLACSFSFPNDPTGIVGLQYRFNGPGAVRGTRLKSATEEFEF
jgi:hypothetical protein